MMKGRVHNRYALLPVIFRVSGQPDIVIEFVVDTGFNGYLTLPLAAVIALGLPWLEDIAANLATDEDVLLPIYAATIVWKGVARSVRVLATGKRPLLGTALLDGEELCAQFIESGQVTVDDIASPG